jgi:hypothetical protein
VGRPIVIRGLALLLMAGLFGVSHATFAQGTNSEGEGADQTGQQTPPSLFEPAPLIKVGTAIRPDFDKIRLPQMHFSLLKQHSKRNTLFAWGGIAAGDARRLLQAMTAAKPIEELWLFSGGGNLEEGLEMGRLVHKARLATHLLSWMQCFSACNFIFMGGTIRSIDPGGVFGVHMFSADIASRMLEEVIESPTTFDQFNERYPDHKLDRHDLERYNERHGDTLDLPTYLRTVVVDANVKKIQQDSAQIAAEIARFLAEMGLSLRFLTEFSSIPTEHPRDLTRDELRDFNIINTD